MGHVPPFAAWIIGGSDEEATLIEKMFLARPPLAALRSRGELVIWGRVATEALPELYARSSVVVVPSSREQFGIVAVEAMMCGTPVIASRVGGLADAVLEGYCGTLIPVDDAAALANAILGYLRSPHRIAREGTNAVQWARAAFVRDDTYRSLMDVYDHQAIPTTFPTVGDIRRQRMSAIRQRVTSILDSPVTVEEVTPDAHVTALASSGDRTYLCRWYLCETADPTSIFPVPRELLRGKTAADYAAALAFHRANSVAAEVVQFPTDTEPIAILRVRERALTSDDDLRRIVTAYRRYRPVDDNDPAAHRLLRTLAGVEEKRSAEMIREFDLAAAELNARMGGTPRFEQVHPDVELLRIQLLLGERTWILAPEFQERLEGTIAFILASRPMAMELPSICHGSLPVVPGDPSGSRYVVGPYDEARAVRSDLVASPVLGPVTALSRLATLVASDHDLRLAALWLLVFVITDSLQAVTSGQDLQTARVMRFCRDFQHLWARQITR